MTYLKVGDDFAESVAHKPSLGDVPENGRWQTEENDKKVSDGQVDDKPAIVWVVNYTFISYKIDSAQCPDVVYEGEMLTVELTCW